MRVQGRQAVDQEAREEEVDAMPWRKNDLPPAAKNLTADQKAVFVRVANKELKEGSSEGSAIRQGIAAAKRAKKGG
jgi:uncharacterized protein YdaT